MVPETEALQGVGAIDRCYPQRREERDKSRDQCSEHQYQQLYKEGIVMSLKRALGICPLNYDI